MHGYVVLTGPSARERRVGVAGGAGSAVAVVVRRRSPCTRGTPPLATEKLPMSAQA